MPHRPAPALPGRTADAGYFLMTIFAIVVCTFLVTSTVVYAAVEAWARPRRQIGSRLAGIAHGLPRPIPASKEESTASSERQGDPEWKRRLRAQILRADWRLRPEEFLTLWLIAALTLGITGWLLTRQPGTGLVTGGLGALLPPALLAQRQEARRRRFDGQIADALTLIVSCLRAGHSLNQALQTVAAQMPPPLADEFGGALGEISLGVSTEAALERMTERVGSEDLDLVVTAISIQLQAGGNLAALLDSIAGTIRERTRVAGETQALTAEGRISALVLFLLPPILALLLHLRSPTYFQPLLHTFLGREMLIGALVAQVMGGLILRRMVAVDR